MGVLGRYILLPHMHEPAVTKPVVHPESEVTYLTVLLLAHNSRLLEHMQIFPAIRHGRARLFQIRRQSCRNRSLLLGSCESEIYWYFPKTSVANGEKEKYPTGPHVGSEAVGTESHAGSIQEHGF